MVDQIFNKSSNNNTTTTVGSTIIVRGNLEGDEDLTVQGCVEGKLSLTKDLFIEPSGVVKADINVQNVYISGILVGNIVATEKVEIAADGRMVGDINSPRLVIHDGASFRGRIEMGSMESSRASVERPTPRAVPPPRPSVRSVPLSARGEEQKVTSPISTVAKGEAEEKKAMVAGKRR
ncbi:MAG: polymer-forming cytoskeletal protein [Deltaproteobacteria bacterium]|nr:MAG: polymer-forming cytoskeletal protein [Deltaproteobacteria bacterium]